MLLQLLAETSPETWVGVVGTAVGALSTFGMGYLAYLTSKSQDRITALEKGARECEENLTVARSELKAIDARDKAQLQAKIDALEGKLRANGSLPETKTHDTL